MRNLIDRQEAINFIDAGHLVSPNEPRWSDNDVVNFLKSRPSAQTAQRAGRWQKISPASECGQTVMTCDIDAYSFCHGCGAKMKRSKDEN